MLLMKSKYDLKGDIMTVLQLILLASHGLLGLLMYKTGFADGLVEGRIKSFQEQR
jgi:hypothetical protein